MGRIDRSVEFLKGSQFGRRNIRGICSVGTILEGARGLECVQCSQCSGAKIAVGTGKLKNRVAFGVLERAFSGYPPFFRPNIGYTYF